MQKEVAGSMLTLTKRGTSLGNVGDGSRRKPKEFHEPLVSRPTKREQATLDKDLLNACSSKKEFPLLVKNLLEEGADPKAMGRFKRTPLINASFNGLGDTVSIILAWAESRYTHAEFVEYLRHTDDFDFNACDWAMVNRKLAVVALFLKYHVY